MAKLFQRPLLLPSLLESRVLSTPYVQVTKVHSVAGQGAEECSRITVSDAFHRMHAIITAHALDTLRRELPGVQTLLTGMVLELCDFHFALVPQQHDVVLIVRRFRPQGTSGGPQFGRPTLLQLVPEVVRMLGALRAPPATLSQGASPAAVAAAAAAERQAVPSLAATPPFIPREQQLALDAIKEWQSSSTANAASTPPPSISSLSSSPSPSFANSRLIAMRGIVASESSSDDEDEEGDDDDDEGDDNDDDDHDDKEVGVDAVDSNRDKHRSGVGMLASKPDAAVASAARSPSSPSTAHPLPMQPVRSTGGGGGHFEADNAATEPAPDGASEGCSQDTSDEGMGGGDEEVTGAVPFSMDMSSLSQGVDGQPSQSNHHVPGDSLDSQENADVDHRQRSAMVYGGGGDDVDEESQDDDDEEDEGEREGDSGDDDDDDDDDDEEDDEDDNTPPLVHSHRDTQSLLSTVTPSVAIGQLGATSLLLHPRAVASAATNGEAVEEGDHDGDTQAAFAPSAAVAPPGTASLLTQPKGDRLLHHASQEDTPTSSGSSVVLGRGDRLPKPAWMDTDTAPAQGCRTTIPGTQQPANGPITAFAGSPSSESPSPNRVSQMATQPQSLLAPAMASSASSSSTTLEGASPLWIHQPLVNMPPDMENVFDDLMDFAGDDYDDDDDDDDDTHTVVASSADTPALVSSSSAGTHSSNAKSPKVEPRAGGHGEGGGGGGRRGGGGAGGGDEWEKVQALDSAMDVVVANQHLIETDTESTESSDDDVDHDVGNVVVRGDDESDNETTPVDVVGVPSPDGTPQLFMSSSVSDDESIASTPNAFRANARVRGANQAGTAVAPVDHEPSEGAPSSPLPPIPPARPSSVVPPKLRQRSLKSLLTSSSANESSSSASPAPALASQAAHVASGASSFSQSPPKADHAPDGTSTQSDPDVHLTRSRRTSPTPPQPPPRGIVHTVPEPAAARVDAGDVATHACDPVTPTKLDLMFRMCGAMLRQHAAIVRTLTRGGGTAEVPGQQHGMQSPATPQATPPVHPRRSRRHRSGSRGPSSTPDRTTSFVAALSPKAVNMRLGPPSSPNGAVLPNPRGTPSPHRRRRGRSPLHHGAGAQSPGSDSLEGQPSRLKKPRIRRS